MTFCDDLENAILNWMVILVFIVLKIQFDSDLINLIVYNLNTFVFQFSMLNKKPFVRSPYVTRNIKPNSNDANLRRTIPLVVGSRNLGEVVPVLAENVNNKKRARVVERVPAEVAIKAKVEIGEPVVVDAAVIQRGDLVEPVYKLVESKRAKKRRIADEAAASDKARADQALVIAEARRRGVEEEAKAAVEAARAEIIPLAIVNEASKGAKKGRAGDITGKVGGKNKKAKVTAAVATAVEIAGETAAETARQLAASILEIPLPPIPVKKPAKKVKRKSSTKWFMPKDVDEGMKDRHALEASDLHSQVVEEHENDPEHEKERVRVNLKKQAYMDKMRKLMDAEVEKQLKLIENSTPKGYLDYGDADDFVDALLMSTPKKSDEERFESPDEEDEEDGWEPFDHLLQHGSSSSSSSSSATAAKFGEGSQFVKRSVKSIDPAEVFMKVQVKACEDSSLIESNEVLDERGWATFKPVANLKTDQSFIVINSLDQFMVLTRQKVSISNTECKVVAKSDGYGKTVTGVSLRNNTLVRVLDLVGLETLKEVSDSGCLSWCNEVEHRRFETSLRLAQETIKQANGSSPSNWRNVIGTPESGRRGSENSLVTNLRSVAEGAKSSVKLQGLQRPISVQMPMSLGLNIISANPKLAMEQDSYQVHGNLALDTSNGHTIGNFHTLQACQIVGAVGDVHKYWRSLCNLTSPGPYSRRDADQIHQLHQHISVTEVDVNDAILKRLMIVSAETNIGANADRVSQLFKNVISLYDSAYIFTEETWDALHGYRCRLEEYLSRHEFGAPHGKCTELMYLKAIYVYCIDMTMMIRAVLANKKILNEQAWLGTVSGLPNLDVGSELWDYHQELSINVSVANNSSIIKKVKVVKKPKGGNDAEEEKEPIKKVNKEGKGKGNKGICYNELTTQGCKYGRKCKFDHSDPKPSEFGAVKQYLDLKGLVAREGLKLE